MRHCLSFLLAAFALPPSLFAGNVIFTTFSTNYSTSAFWGFGYDPSTGTYYAHSGYGGSTTPLDVYSSVAAFAANTPTSVVTLTSAATGCQYSTPCTPLDGTYFTVDGPDVIGRPTDNTAALEEWLIPSGSTHLAMTYSQFGGINGYDTFDWGGFSGMNVFQDSTGIYLLAVNPNTSTWDVSTLNPTTLAVTNTFNTGLAYQTLSYGFLINGQLYLGANYYNNVVAYDLNVKTGQVTSANFTLQLPGASSYYISDTLYDPNLDRLYIWNGPTGQTGQDTLYEVNNASQMFTPEPGAGVLALAGCCAIALVMRRRRRTPIALPH